MLQGQLQTGEHCVSLYVATCFVDKLQMVPNIALLTRGENLSSEFVEMKYIALLCVLVLLGIVTRFNVSATDFFFSNFSTPCI